MNSEVGGEFYAMSTTTGMDSSEPAHLFSSSQQQQASNNNSSPVIFVVPTTTKYLSYAGKSTV